MTKQAGYTTASLALTALTSWLGGWDMAVKTLVALLVMDYVSGVLAAIKDKRVNSDVMFWGGLRKGIVLGVICFAVMLDNLLGNTQPVFRTLTIYYYTAREGVSIVENIGLLGVPLPPFLSGVLSQLQSKGGNSDPAPTVAASVAQVVTDSIKAAPAAPEQGPIAPGPSVPLNNIRNENGKPPSAV